MDLRGVGEGQGDGHDLDEGEDEAGEGVVDEQRGQLVLVDLGEDFQAAARVRLLVEENVGFALAILGSTLVLENKIIRLRLLECRAALIAQLIKAQLRRPQPF